MRKQRKAESVKRISFDLYDTIITRRVSDPHRIFEETALDAPNIGLSPEAFRKRRVKAEKIARRNNESGECSFDDIYKELATLLRTDLGTMSRLQQAELEKERENSYLIEAQRKLIERSREEADQVWIITDMYLPRSFLTDLLEKFEILPLVDKLVISSEESASKSAGTLYDRYLDGAIDWTHIGDNRRSDIDNAEARGIKTSWTRISHPNEDEKRVERDHSQGHSYASAMREARLLCPNSSNIDAWTIGANHSGPMAWQYALWIAEKAKALDLDQVVFLARDGQLLHQAYQRLARSKPDLPPATYLAASRLAWLPCILNSDHEDSGRIAEKHIGEDFEQFFSSLGVEAARESTLRELLTSSEFRTAAANRMELIKTYFEQEGIWKARRIGLVDIGWKGTMQSWMRTLLKDLQPNRPTPSVIGLNYSLEVHSIEDQREAYLEKPHWLPSRETLHTSVMEMLLPADHGQILGYRDSTDGGLGAEPIASPKTIAPLSIIEAMQAGAKAFFESALQRDLYEQSAPIRGYLRLLLFPNTDERRCFRKFSFSTFARDEQAEYSLIPKLARKEIIKLCLSPRRSTAHWPWPAATCLEAFPGIHRFWLRLLLAKLYICKTLERGYLALRKAVTKTG